MATTTAADCGVVPNTADLTFDGGSGSDDASVTVDCPNITVEKSGNGPIVNGGTATFTITVTNDGPGDGQGRHARPTSCPPGTGPSVAPTPPTARSDGSNLLTCDFGDVDAPGGEADNVREISVTKTADAGDCGTIPNTVTVGASNEAPDDTGDDTDSATIDVRCPDVDLDKTVDDSSVEPNQTVTYTIHVKVVNGPVTNAVVTDDLPDGQTYTRGLGVPVGAGRQRWRQDPDLDVREPAAAATRPSTITYDVTVDADANGDPQENEATVCVDEPTPCASDVALITPEFPDIQIIKTAGDAADGETYSTEPGRRHLPLPRHQQRPAGAPRRHRHGRQRDTGRHQRRLRGDLPEDDAGRRRVDGLLRDA